MGARLFIGDFHACMGDGEVSGTAIETPGRALVRVSLRRDRSIQRPVIETGEAIYFLASAPTLDESVRLCVLDAVHYLMEKLALNFQDAYRAVQRRLRHADQPGGSIPSKPPGPAVPASMRR